MATRYVLPLESLRMTDVASVGGKNASLGELISQLAASGVRVPGGFATTARAFDDFLAHNRLTERIRAELASAGRGRRRRARQGGRARSARWCEGAAMPARARAPDPRRNTRASPRDQPNASFAVRSSATAEDLPDASFAGPAGDLPQHPRRRERARGGEARLRLALQRPRHRLPRAQGLRARRGVDLRGRAAHGAQRPGRRRRRVHAGHRVGLPRGGVHHLGLRPGRDGGAGRGEPGRVLRLEAVPRRGQARDPAPRAWAPRRSSSCSTPRRRPGAR